jgi:MscS family membrane protein
MNPPTMDQFLTSITDFGGENSWVVQVFAVILVSLLFSYLVRFFLNRLHKKMRTTKNPWDDALVDSLRLPLVVLIWVIGIAFAAQIVARQTNAPIFEAIDPLRTVGVIFSFIWFLIRLTNGIARQIVEKGEDEVDRTTVEALAKLVRVSFLITGVLVGLQSLGFSISGVLAFGGIGGIAVGFAAKDLLANFFGGVIVYLDRPFSVGDWIRSPDRQIEGTVEKIGWRVTMIRTFDKRPIYVPNATFTSIVVENPSRMTNRRIKETIGIRYDDADKLESIVAEVEKMLREHTDIDQSQTLMVNFNSFAASSLDFFIYTFTKTVVWAEYHRVKQDVLFRIQRIITEAGAEIAYPTSTLHVPDGVSIEVPSDAPATS